MASTFVVRPASFVGGWLGKSAIPALGAAGIALILLFLAAIVGRSATLFQNEQGIQSLARLFADPDYYSVLLNTLYFAVVTTATAAFFGLPIAWLTERTELPGRSAVRVIMNVGMLIPGFFTAMGWLFLAHPRIGLFSLWFREAFGISLNVATLTGMAMIQGLALATLTFVVAAPSLGAVDPVLEESAEVHGLRLWSRLTKVTFPLIAPALFASTLLTFMVSLAVFDIPAVLGLSNKIMLYSTYIYVLINPSIGVPFYEVAAASSIPMLIFAILLSAWYYRFIGKSKRYQVVSGKAYRSTPTKIGKLVSTLGWGFIFVYMLLAILLPLAMIGWVSLFPFFRPVSAQALVFASLENYTGLFTHSFLEAVSNTLILVVVAPSLCVVLALATSWVVTRQQGRTGRWFEMIVFLPLSIPSVIFAVGAISLSLAWGSAFAIYGTIWLVVLVEVVIRLSLATRVTNSAMLQLNNELDEAGAVFGLSPYVRFTRIITPLLAPAIAYCWFFLALLAFRELTVPALLVSRDNVTISVYSWGLINGGSFGRASALTLIIILTLVAIAVFALAITRLYARLRVVKPVAVVGP